MAQDEGSSDDRQLPATERRLQKAREEGQVPRSRDLGHLLVLGASAGLLAGLASWLGGESTALLRGGLAFERAAAFDPQYVGRLAGAMSLKALTMVLPFAFLGAIMAVAASLAVGGLVTSTKSLEPQLSRISPMAGLGRIFSKEGLFDLGKLTVVAVGIGTVATMFILGRMGELSALAMRPLGQGLGQTLAMLGAGAVALLVTLAVVATIDVPLAIWRHARQLRMSVEDVKQEHKESEGDPHVKAQIRQRQREVARRRMLSNVATADVVVTNPTHFAVALKYDDARGGAPRVVAKGADFLAARIRQLADEAAVPRLESPPLARALYRHVKLDAEIPAALYTAVAQVLAWVYRLRRHRPGVDRWPDYPAIEVPDGLDPGPGGLAADKETD